MAFTGDLETHLTIELDDLERLSVPTFNTPNAD